MPHIFCCRFFVIILLVLPLALRAGLEWESTHLEVPAESGQEEVVGVFKFTNKSSQSIRIVSANSSCGCTVPKLNKKSYAPGESGELRAIFTLGARTGHQRKTISVTTNEPGSRVTQLTLETDIPAFVTVEPRMLMWTLGSEAKWKEMKIYTDPAYQLSIEGRANSESLPPFELTQAKRAGQYLLKIRPQSTAARGQTRIPLYIELPDGAIKTYTVYLVVR